jgi:predicted nucleic acid-binding protein
VALVVLDASVVIGFLNPQDTLHDACVAALSEHQHDNLVVPASVYAEILVAPYRASADAVAKVEAFLSDFGVTVEPVTATIARAAARLRSERKSLRLPDALVLASADAIGADVVVSGDESWTKSSRRVTVVRAH